MEKKGLNMNCRREVVYWKRLIVNVAAPQSLKVAGWVEDNPLEINLYLISDFGRKHLKLGNTFVQ